MATNVRDIPRIERAASGGALRRVLSEAKASGNLTTWLAILLSLAVTCGTVLIQAGRIIDRQDSIRELLIVNEKNRDREVEELRLRVAKVETENGRLNDRITSTRELVIAAGLKPPKEK